MNGDSYSSREGGGGRHHGGSRDHHQSRGGDRDDRRDRDRGDRNRRRSRSPRNRRDPGGEVDTYSSSRNHRDREREDRYSTGRERRDRDWDRDRSGRGGHGGHGRDSRRDDGDDRRAHRDNFDDRRPPRREREGRDNPRDNNRDQDRRRSATPPPKKREPTPDLTDVTSVLDRKRRLTQWDIKPPGYDAVTAEQAKLSGMFPLPGAPRQQQVDPTKLQAFMKGPGESGAATGALKPTSSRQAKRLIVKNLPAGGTSEEDLVSFFNLQLNGLNVVQSVDPCVLAQVSGDGSFAVVEFKEATDATIALALDGITMTADDSNGDKPKGLDIARPKDYIVPAVVDDSVYEPGIVSSTVIDTPNKISVANIPLSLTDEQVTELLVAFGELKAFVLVKDRSTEESRGIAFCEYVESASTEIAISGLNGMDLGSGMLKVRKASIGITQISSIEMGVNAMSMLAGTTSLNADVSRVVQLLNMVTPEELMDNDDYEEILEDIQEECSKFGKILNVKIPRPTGGSRQSAGVGKIFVKYDTTDSATTAMKALAGRKFADRTVVTTYFPEENFEVSAW